MPDDSEEIRHVDAFLALVLQASPCKSVDSLSATSLNVGRQEIINKETRSHFKGMNFLGIERAACCEATFSLARTSAQDMGLVTISGFGGHGGLPLPSPSKTYHTLIMSGCINLRLFTEFSCNPMGARSYI